MEFLTRYGKVGLAVVVHSKEIAEYPHSDSNTYLLARNGTEYSIAAWNFTDRRMEAVITVDGLDIITGQVGDYRNQRGYVIPAHTKPRPIPGFRLDANNVARFTFGAPGSSYAALMNKPTNIGVIGAAFFSEWKMPVFHSMLFAPDLRSPEQFGGMVTKGASVGTGFGRQTDFHTSETHFTRENPAKPDAILALHYHTRERLAEMGIDVSKRPIAQVATGPSPFPANRDGCLPPEGWTGK